MNVELHRPIVDEENNIVTYLLYNLSGCIVGYQQYNPNGEKSVANKKHGKYYTYRKSPTIAVWGLESLYQSQGPIYLTEGIYDAARMTERGQSAIAALCNNPPKEYRNWLMMLNRTIVVVCDNDAAGRKLAKCGHYVETVPNGDLGSSTDDYVNYLIQKYTMCQL
jgi:DNA primase